MWVAVAGVALAGVSMIGGAQTASAQGAASEAQARGKVNLDKASQAEKNAQSELSRQIQKINNERKMKAAQANFAKAATNVERMKADLVGGKIEQQIAASEALGAYVANTASKGIGGSSADVIETTIRMRDARKQKMLDDNEKALTYDAAQQMAGIIPNAWDSQDMTVINGGVANSVALQEVRPGYNFAGALQQSGLLGYMGDLLGPSKSAATGNAGQGLSLPGGELGLAAPKTGFWNSSSSTVLL